MATGLYTTNTGLAITNPLMLYRTLVAAQRIQPDEAQHRLAIHLQKLYHRLKDYEPQQDYRNQLEKIGVLLDQAKATNPDGNAKGPRSFPWLRSQSKDSESKALTRRLTNYESALSIDSPRGLLLHGEVGTGKSMLVDLLADSLPTRKKRRYHFNTFMLETFMKLERIRKERSSSYHFDHFDQEYDQSLSLMHLAREFIAESPILFLDEFQLPDRAASKIVSNLFIPFFHLGGVLIATSNRMPEDLASASGIEFGSMPQWTKFKRVHRAFFGRAQHGVSENMFSRKSDLTSFLEVLKARCETWDMNSGIDWRRASLQESLKTTPSDCRSHSTSTLSINQEQPAESSLKSFGPNSTEDRSIDAVNDATHNEESSRTPRYYFTDDGSWDPTEIDRRWSSAIGTIAANEAKSATLSNEIQWSSRTLQVYGRTVNVPKTYGGVCLWTFSDLCVQTLGPADYITLASSFHTFIIIDIPTLSLLQKNEARRFITLLDALYEARCKLLLRAAAGPDEIFFPESQTLLNDKFDEVKEHTDTVYPETFSEIYQDATAPFRPNISSYHPSASSPSYSHSPMPQNVFSLAHSNVSLRSILADEDSDFGPPYPGGSSSAPSSINEAHRPSDTAPRLRHEANETPNFQRTSVFTGEDERFAYRRARSRLWEMCGSKWWAREENWWRPLSKDVRHWERDAVTHAGLARTARHARKESVGPESITSPFRTTQEPTPKISWVHAWGMMSWGRKSGAWGKGVEGLAERKEQRGKGSN